MCRNFSLLREQSQYLNLLAFPCAFATILCIEIMANILPIIQIILSVILIAGILLQTSAAGLGGALGGSDGVDAGMHTRRGFEKFLFHGTVIVAILFVIVSFISFISL